MIQFSKDFRDFLEILINNECEFMIIGGYALAFYGYPRFTGDLDIWINNNKNNANKLIKSLNDFGVKIPGLEAKDLTTNKPMTGLYFGREPYKIDIISSLENLEFEKCYKNSKEFHIENFKVKFISLIDLKINKQTSGRLKDLADIEELEKRMKDDADTNNKQ